MLGTQSLQELDGVLATARLRVRVAELAGDVAVLGELHCGLEGCDGLLRLAGLGLDRALKAEPQRGLGIVLLETLGHLDGLTVVTGLEQDRGQGDAGIDEVRF